MGHSASALLHGQHDEGEVCSGMQLDNVQPLSVNVSPSPIDYVLCRERDAGQAFLAKHHNGRCANAALRVCYWFD
jgi:hypothetical protein